MVEYMAAPTITSEDDKMLVKAGLPAAIKCTTYGSPPPEIQWYKDDEQIVYNTKYTVSLIGIMFSQLFIT